MFLSLQILTSFNALSSSSLLSSPASRHFSNPEIPYYSRVLEDVPAAPLELRSQLTPKKKSDDLKVPPPANAAEELGGGEKRWIEGISGMQVPRQRYIAVSKSELLDAILLMFDSQEEVDQFRLLSSCLDSILHAEHKSILEGMRVDYDVTHSTQNKATIGKGLSSFERSCVPNEKGLESAMDNPVGIDSREKYGEDKLEPHQLVPSNSALDLIYLLGFSFKSVYSNSCEESRVAVATRFQRAFVQLLYNAQFEELSARDLLLTSALNTDYLLTLPINVDWRRAAESNAIIFRRGYATERQKGLLIVEKLDYLQSKLLQGILFGISQPLRKVGIWLAEAFQSYSQVRNAQIWANKIKFWLKELPLLRQPYGYDEYISENMLTDDRLMENDLPIWLAAQKAVTRYEGILSTVGPRSRLLRKLLTWIGLAPSTPQKKFDVDSDIAASEPYLRPISLSRISLGDIWEPATSKSCGNDFWKMLTNALSILLSQSILEEPAFEELILLYTEEVSKETEDKAEVPSLQLKIYEKILIPDLPVIFPHKKLSFRILDTVRLDAASILGLLAYFINYKFEDILSSPSAILLDVIAISGLVIVMTRVALGYKQTWDRYQLLVNKTLYEKTLASGFGSVHFLLDASEQQQYKEAILTYAILLKVENGQITCTQSVADKCERFMYNAFEEKVEMPIGKAMDTLVRLGLVTQSDDEKIGLQAVRCPKAYEILKQHWHSLLVS